MNEVICWLNMSLGLTAVLWMPYIINRLFKQGAGGMGYAENLPAVSAWAERAKKAHYNAVENLVVLAPAVFSYLLLQGSELKSIACALQVYFFARIIHYLSYTFKIPYIRTLSFSAGWASTIYIIVKVCQLANIGQ